MDPLLQKRLYKTLQTINREKLPEFHAVMLPDFFVDHFLSLETVEKTFNAVQSIARQGGGNLPGIKQQLHHGGNAANTALALARLGITSHLICRTDALGMHLLKYFLEKEGVDLSGVKTDGALAITTAMEFGADHTNVMLGDPGSVADFSFERLTDHDHQLLATADVVGVVNWNLNRSGTTLASKVVETAKKHGVKTFFDSGDPSPRVQDIPELMSCVLMNPYVDVIGLNENEIRYYSKSTGTTQEDLMNAARMLKKKIPARIDIHTAQFSGTIHKTCTVVPTLTLSTLYRSTGAGDAWNAANLFADLLEFADDERLLFANIYAGHYITSPTPNHDTIETILNSIKKTI
jgi:sugar/nucleoside kinase (ribokinase family)